MPRDRLKIYRRFDFGTLLSLHMLDTRIEGRDRQYDNYGDADGGLAATPPPSGRAATPPAG
jgi:alkaline phosphatase D